MLGLVGNEVEHAHGRHAGIAVGPRHLKLLQFLLDRERLGRSWSPYEVAGGVIAVNNTVHPVSHELKEIIAELGKQLEPIARDPRPKDVQHTLTLVDGTLRKGLPVLVQAGLPDPRTAKLQAKFRLHTQFDLERGVPIRIDVIEGINNHRQSRWYEEGP